MRSRNKFGMTKYWFCSSLESRNTVPESSIRAAVCKIGIRKLDYLNAAKRLADLKAPPGNRLEALKGNYAGKYSIRTNDQYRIVFRFIDSDAYDVEITDYH